MSEIRVNLNLSLPQVKLPESKAFKQIQTEAHKLAHEIDSAAAKHLKALRQEAEHNGIDVKGAEKTVKHWHDAIDKQTQKLLDQVPVKGQLHVSADHIKLSGRVAIPERESNSPLFLDSPHVIDGSKAELGIQGLTAGAGFVGGLALGATMGVKPNSKLAVFMGTSALVMTTGAAISGAYKLEREEAKLGNYAAAGTGFCFGMLAGMGIAKLALHSMGASGI
ncbi:hypothetical protein COW36_17065 [bacterium (Candidatus Blackallbacteria) CG17_big_fil_post_rev_8_21_14_2_50_48_46]|uniref:Uncharacterized protein n=1 Tax=bacterium (Candidatus Blackallbacteria) CG17_big_fil_post_rev_8_21_14_2_50_48_46 TaxID=2014261 RepID=A0A2M7G1B8_9BACT|nr:MAG: hypothetical protein COW64_09375 [bacterium (Candidatus Blackallbacteria) CG18_big_fil_WC_8_21_14_2_50_49_26]PIW15512.1 MAG: hypothetical protein COW36_17065 [bacterium (Candidatus Blackallbacteria) CG17_big_fil_post_rev_8_21_14_2_50_48_46]PIW48587.1 MAG: hypothetical protein COW20_08775 [bacterium (Candidatus Blackallbacteria) CG13_big_fil_rev_8_21_14_2_50_49_14]